MKVDLQYPVDSLSEAKWNPRTIEPQARKVLSASLEKYGMLEWIVVDARDQKTILSGHQRFSVLKGAGVKTVPVLFVDVLDDNMAEMVNVTLNNPHVEGTWDMPKLEAMQAELSATGMFEPLEVGLIGSGILRQEETTVVPRETKDVSAGEYLKVFRLHFLPNEWEFFTSKAAEVMKAHSLANYSELVLWLARNYGI